MKTAGKLVKKIVGDEFTSNYFIGRKHNIESLKRFEWGTRFNESANAFGEAYIVWGALEIGLEGYNFPKELGDGNYGITIILGTALLLNSSLIMLQRYNRARVHNIIEKKEKRKNIF